MRVGLYARVSTLDKDQDPETQLVALREFVRAQGWEIFREYVDHAPARDLTHRTAWRELLDDAARKRFKTVVVFRLDRAFRSVKDMHDTLATWELCWGSLSRACESSSSRVPGSGVRGRGSGERETTASSLAGKQQAREKEDNGGQGKDGPAGAIAQGGNGR